MSKHNIVYMTPKALKGSTITDHLIENTVNDYESLKFYFPGEGIMALTEYSEDEEFDDKWKKFFDGAIILS